MHGLRWYFWFRKYRKFEVYKRLQFRPNLPVDDAFLQPFVHFLNDIPDRQPWVGLVPVEQYLHVFSNIEMLSSPSTFDEVKNMMSEEMSTLYS